jgi:hypothetical protein
MQEAKVKKTPSDNMQRIEEFEVKVKM